MCSAKKSKAVLLQLPACPSTVLGSFPALLINLGEWAVILRI
uniref:Uncharacterized protein n=1 Tax=Escherichia coli TaxID=562 RepID=A0A3G4RXM7_ECOLX|nr:hypothetical protein D0362_00281 [Escherichia coli]